MIGYTATEMLKKAGIPVDNVNQLFYTKADNGYWPADKCATPLGSEAYAKAGAEGVRMFMQQFETQLKQTRLVKNKEGVLVVDEPTS